MTVLSPRTNSCHVSCGVLACCCHSTGAFATTVNSPILSPVRVTFVSNGRAVASCVGHRVCVCVCLLCLLVTNGLLHVPLVLLVRHSSSNVTLTFTLISSSVPQNKLSLSLTHTHTHTHTDTHSHC